MSDNPKVLLVADFNWRTRGGGSEIVRSLVGHEIGKTIAFATLTDPGKGSERWRYVLAEGSIARFGRSSYLWDSVLGVKRIAKEVVKLANHLKVKRIWFVLHGAVVQIANRSRQLTNIPIHVSVHDDPPYGVGLRSTRQLLMVPKINRDFRSVLQHATSVDVISIEMQNYYRSKHGINSTVVHRGLNQHQITTAAANPEKQLSIGILGNTYGQRQLRKLVKVLLRLKLRQQSDIGLVLIGRSPHFEQVENRFSKDLKIERLGHLSETLAVETLSKCDLLYLNYPFDWNCGVFRRTSFPTKLSTYLLSRRPILVHAPAGSTIGKLPASKLVTHWRTMKPCDGEEIINDVVSRQQDVVKQLDTARELLHRFYDIGKNREELASLLGVNL